MHSSEQDRALGGAEDTRMAAASGWNHVALAARSAVSRLQEINTAEEMFLKMCERMLQGPYCYYKQIMAHQQERCLGEYFQLETDFLNTIFLFYLSSVLFQTMCV